MLISVLKATKRAGYAWTPRRQGMAVTQGELGPPGCLGDTFKTLVLILVFTNFLRVRYTTNLFDFFDS